jgi:hypothetical protein
MNDLEELIQRAIGQWRSEDIPIRPGVASTTIAEFESRYHVRLPQDMRSFYTAVDGLGDHMDKEWLYRFWPFEQIKPMSEYRTDIWASSTNPDCFFFFDHSIELSLYAIRLSARETANPIAQIMPKTSVHQSTFEDRFDSFTSFLSTYVNAPSILL